MRTTFLSALALGICLAICGCAASNTASQQSTANDEYHDLSSRHTAELVSYAALLRVKIKRERRIDDFRVEIFSRQPDELSLYVRGFLGTAVFKAVVRGDALVCYFPREGRFFQGELADLESGSLSESRHIIDLLLSFYRGSYELGDNGVWNRRIKRKGHGFELVLVDTVKALRFDTHLDANHETFPYLRAETIKLATREKSFMANIGVKSSSFNRAIPDEKFELEIPESAVSLSREDLSDLLTNLGQ